MRKLVTTVLCAAACFLAPCCFSAPINLGFESGLAGFSFLGQGSATILTALGPVVPKFGSNMGFLTNGPGDAGGSPDLATLRSDLFTLAVSDTLTFSVLRLTSEFTGVDADPLRLDSFLVRLVDSNGATVTTIHSSNVGSAGFSAIPGAPANSPGGDAFYEYTPWVDFSLSGLSGTFRIEFVVADIGDSSFDSAFLIDGEAVGGGGPPSPVPEPDAWTTSGIGLALVMLRRFSRAVGQR